MSDLRALAAKATPGPLEVMDFDGEQFLTFPAGRAGAFVGSFRIMADAEYHAALVNEVLALLDRAERAEAALREMRDHLDKTISHTEHYECDFVWCEAAHAIKEEIDRELV
jgi:hypothetical protein